MIITDDYIIPSDKQMDILELVYKFRFINRKQIQYLMGHKDARRINAWLKDLVEHKYLGRIYSHKLLENTKPAIYYLANEGIGWVRVNHYEDEPYKVKRFYQDKHASERFINHCISLCDLYIKYQELAKKNKGVCLIGTSTELWYEEELKNIRPDACIEVQPEDGDDIDYKAPPSFLLELIEQYVPMYALRYKIDRYIAFKSETEAWDIYATEDLKSIHIRMVLPDQKKLNRIKKYIQRRLNESYDVDGLTFFLTTNQQVKEKGLTDGLWQEVKEE
ncbi:hypothetical protein A2867_02810 [Candidatus Daviesbacteria bacterium RIFCSPHIGHO2_01_FULL_40_11]|uniref:Replication-relaxation n=1 Tax=Candidatus Daviesbacteria bacterium RIFCSPHIGHO2_01_FULL_40_11 TaxID=1797762 RepID=A0A1F5JKR6_9BACT|nr:MAG: hypothetical protein A2867_02810 [Candidatus Daviesbacteria bacterium RIFCSPHIGHO2_01_FULL_40_11]OGE62966.1 MAG: hypothetical protein A2964_01635 [Candidatus Daviesbacteria bacterium RIFCSPLOWO2_01_FULL_40_27]